MLFSYVGIGSVSADTKPRISVLIFEMQKVDLCIPTFSYRHSSGRVHSATHSNCSNTFILALVNLCCRWNALRRLIVAALADVRMSAMRKKQDGKSGAETFRLPQQMAFFSTHSPLGQDSGQTHQHTHTCTSTVEGKKCSHANHCQVGCIMYRS